MKKLLLAGAIALGFSLDAVAGEGEIGPFQLDSVALIAAPLGLHKAGNVEVAVTGGFVPPAGVNCGDRYWITTLKDNDKDRALFKTLRSARNNQQTVKLVISDDYLQRAYPNRCSLKGVEVVSRFVWQ